MATSSAFKDVKLDKNDAASVRRHQKAELDFLTLYEAETLKLVSHRQRRIVWLAQRGVLPPISVEDPVDGPEGYIINWKGWIGQMSARDVLNNDVDDWDAKDEHDAPEFEESEAYRIRSATNIFMATPATERTTSHAFTVEQLQAMFRTWISSASYWALKYENYAIGCLKSLDMHDPLAS